MLLPQSDCLSTEISEDEITKSTFNLLGNSAICGAFFLSLALPNAFAEEGSPTIHTVLQFDGIPAIFNPKFVPAADAKLHADSPVIGVDLNGEQHAYSMILLNHHEIVNDVVGGIPIATTW